MNNEYYEYNYCIDNKEYLLKFNNKHIIVCNSNKESITLNNDSFMYCKRDKKDSINIEQVIVERNLLSFYNRVINNDSEYATSIKASSFRDIFTFAKIAREIKKDYLEKVDTIINYEDDKTNISITNRKYDNKGHLIDNTYYAEESDRDINEYILNELNNDTVYNLLSKIDNILPGIIDLLKEININLNGINSMNKKRSN